MEYNIQVIADLDITGQTREAIIPIELTEQEVANIRSVIVPGDDRKTWEQVKEQFDDIYLKINRKILPFLCYTVILDNRLSGDWRIGNAGTKEDEFLAEDTNSNGFVPFDEKGEPLKGNQLYYAWLRWEEEQLNCLDYYERYNFYANRYHIRHLEVEEVSYVCHFPKGILTL